MPDNLKKRVPQDSSRISLAEEWEVRYWTESLGVSREQLDSLVREYGHSAEAIKRTLHKTMQVP